MLGHVQTVVSHRLDRLNEIPYCTGIATDLFLREDDAGVDKAFLTFGNKATQYERGKPRMCSAM